MRMVKTQLAMGALVVATLLTACGDSEVREIVVTATPEPSVDTASSGEVVSGARATGTPAPASVPIPQPTTQTTTSVATPSTKPDAGHETQAERNRTVIQRYVEDEQDAATLTNVIITCAASAGIALKDHIKTGGRAEDQMSELILAGVLDNYEVLECTADEIVKEVDDGS